MRALSTAAAIRDDDLNGHDGVRCSTPRCDTLRDSVVSLLALTALQPAIGLARSVIFCRWLDPAALGQWDLLFGFVMLAAPLAVLGIPGSFGRYVERYRQRGRLGTFVTRTSVGCAALATLAVCSVWAAAPTVSLWIFGDARHAGTVQLVSVCLAAVIAFSFTTELLTAMRRFRVVSGLQLARSALFAIIAVLLLAGWRTSPESIVIAYATASIAAGAAAVLWLRDAWRPGAVAPTGRPGERLWRTLMSFAAWIWVINGLANMFEVADRYMIVHFSGMPPHEALAQVGHYHSSRIIPLLFVGFAGTLSSMILPHLSHDWEQGRRREVSDRVNLTIKLSGIAMCVGGALVLAVSPLIFSAAFAGKYDGGLAVLPWTMACCVWFGMAFVCEMYLWCAEKARHCGVAIFAALVVNVALNLLLLPRFGLLGAVMATAASKLLVLVVLYLFGARCDLRLEGGTWFVIALPLTLVLGAWTAIAAVALATWLALSGDRLFSPAEKRQLADALAVYVDRLRLPRVARSA